VLQDRLVKEMRLRGIKDLAAANGFLSSEFLQSVNDKFGHSAVSSVNYHRPVPRGLRLEDVFVFEEERTVQNDWTVCWDSRWFQISGPKARMPHRRERIVVRKRLDGSRVLLHRGRDLEFHEIEQRPSRAKSARKPAPVTASRPVSVPPEDHPWRKPFTAAGAQATRERQLRISNR
jgi:hypothetical protein